MRDEAARGPGDRPTPGGTAGASLRLRVPPDPHFARYVRERVSGFATMHGVGQHDLTDLVTAVGEALANAIEHSGTQETIEVACWIVGDSQLIATIVDSGVGFETSGTELEPELPEAMSERGRGLALMARCTDLFSIRSAPSRGTSVILGRRFRPVEPAPADALRERRRGNEPRAGTG